MVDSIAGIVLAAGAGERLRPLTHLRPKVLCPVGSTTLLDHNLDRVARVVGTGRDRLAVNANHLHGQIEAHVARRAEVSVEAGAALGTAGGVAGLGRWLAGRPALVVNGDTWSTIDLAPLVEGWDGERVRVLVRGPAGTELVPARSWDALQRQNAHVPPGQPWRAVPVPGSPEIVGSLLPGRVAAAIPERPLGLSNGVFWPALARGALDVLAAEGELISCDRPRDYLRANLAASGGEPVIGAGAVVEGEVERSVVWPGATVRRGEHLVGAIRASSRVTVLVR